MTELIECPKCKGSGKTTPEHYWATTSSREPSMIDCTICLGTGKINPNDIGTKIVIALEDEVLSIRNDVNLLAVNIQNLFHEVRGALALLQNKPTEKKKKGLFR